MTSLLWASRAGHLEVVKYLVNHGADIHAVDNLFDISMLFLKAKLLYN